MQKEVLQHYYSDPVCASETGEINIRSGTIREKARESRDKNEFVLYHFQSWRNEERIKLRIDQSVSFIIEKIIETCALFDFIRRINRDLSRPIRMEILALNLFFLRRSNE